MNRVAGAVMLGFGTLSLAVLYQGPHPDWLYLVALGQLFGGVALLVTEQGSGEVRWHSSQTAIEVAPEERSPERRPE